MGIGVCMGMKTFGSNDHSNLVFVAPDTVRAVVTWLCRLPPKRAPLVGGAYQARAVI
jgi:hypothetical protein